jgi:hypothetical protein
MPNPVLIPTGPLPITTADITNAEAFVAAFLRLIESGAVGGTDPSLLPSATVLPPGPDQSPASLSLTTAAAQLFYRQLGVAISAAFQTGSAGPGAPTATLLMPTFVSNGVTKGSGVYLTSAGRVANGDCATDAKSLVLGVASASVASGGGVGVLVAGALTGGLSGATPGTPYFLGPTDGHPALYESLSAGNRMIQLGIATSSSNLEVQIVDYGMR